MFKLLKILAIVILLSGCAIHYHNEKSINGKGSKIKTKIGNVDAAKATFISTFDLWLPWKMKK